jgi:hypothetical protein
VRVDDAGHELERLAEQRRDVVLPSEIEQPQVEIALLLELRDDVALAAVGLLFRLVQRRTRSIPNALISA